MSWKKAMQEAVQERNPEMLQQRVWDAETAVMERWREMGKGTSLEERELHHAAEMLLRIQGERLGYPVVRREGAAAHHIPTMREHALHV